MQYLRHSLRSILSIVLLCIIGCNQGLEPQRKNSLPPHTDGSSRISIEIVDSVCGTLIREDTVLSIYDSETQQQVLDPITISHGKETLSLLKGKCYTFKLAGKRNRLAASTLENYAVTKDTQNLTLIQRVPQMGSAVEAPSITDITLNGRTFTDNQHCSNDAGTVLQVVFRAPSRAIQPAPKAGNFACAFGIGSSASAYSKVRETTPVCEYNPDGSWTCTARFPLENIPFLPTQETLTITAYDLAGNRIERHINNVTFKNNLIGGAYVPDSISIQDFQVEMIRYPHSLRLFAAQEHALRSFGLQPHDGRSTSYETKLWFSVKHLGANVPITAFEIYRRDKGQESWERVQRKQYTSKYSGADTAAGFPPSYKGKHLAYDTTPIEEGKEYEYYVKVFIDKDHFITSPIGTVRLLPACTIRLVSPADNTVVKKSELKALSFTFQLTNPALWEKEQARYFDFGILITERTAEDKKIFAGKMTIALNADTGKRLSIRLSDKKDYRLSKLKEKGILPESITEDDIVSYHNGYVTLKPAYLVQQLNNTNTIPEFKSGHTYSWEIFDWEYNEPARFVAVWFTKDWNGNSLTKAKLHTSESLANRLRSAGSLNGHFYFTVTDN
ncbi:MAG: dentilisin complex subunit PrcA [Treponema sp.]